MPGPISNRCWAHHCTVFLWPNSRCPRKGRALVTRGIGGTSEDHSLSDNSSRQNPASQRGVPQSTLVTPAVLYLLLFMSHGSLRTRTPVLGQTTSLSEGRHSDSLEPFTVAPFGKPIEWTGALSRSSSSRRRRFWIDRSLVLQISEHVVYQSTRTSFKPDAPSDMAYHDHQTLFAVQFT
jgi:hypothetical protein